MDDAPLSGWIPNQGDKAFRFALILGEATINVRFLADGITRLRLDLIGQGSDGRGMAVSEVVSGDDPVTFRHRDGELFIELPAPSRANQRSQYTKGRNKACHL